MTAGSASSNMIDTYIRSVIIGTMVLVQLHVTGATKRNLYLIYPSLQILDRGRRIRIHRQGGGFGMYTNNSSHSWEARGRGYVGGGLLQAVHME